MRTGKRRKKRRGEENRNEKKRKEVYKNSHFLDVKTLKTLCFT